MNHTHESAGHQPQHTTRRYGLDALQHMLSHPGTQLYRWSLIGPCKPVDTEEAMRIAQRDGHGALFVDVET